ncbi:DUF2956 domain-containing protein [Pseudaeromonas sp. ZJS20]|uniref:DUF2956 domain-containing protein n=1 Tax=Pseudaeromonas aegiceratis TaxID=3153928 RepID=UPI00390C5244
MPRYDKPQPPSPESQADAERIARATQKPGQTKEQTRLIAQGIQKGIEEYKRQQKAKARARDKAKKKPSNGELEGPADASASEDATAETGQPRRCASWLPWSLLLLSWLLFAVHLALGQ